MKIPYKRIDKRSRTLEPCCWDGRNRYEHWLVDNQVYFITSRCRERYPAFASAGAQATFWERFDHHASQHGYTPWVTTLMNNHYHTLGYLRHGSQLPRFMQRLHGSVAKLVNDLLPERRTEFWRTRTGHEYFDGCIRDEQQARRAYRYTLLQSVRAGLVARWEMYPNTRVNCELDAAVRRSHELGAFLEGVPYKRYDDARRGILRVDREKKG